MKPLTLPGAARPSYRVFLWAYGLLLWAMMPLVWRYFRRRADKDRAYGQHLEERKGEGAGFDADLWVHAVSLGEMTSAEPLVDQALAAGQRVLTTHATPAGRRRAETVYAGAIERGDLAVRYAPVDRAIYWRRFFQMYRPKVGLAMEMEFWPAMIETAREAGVLFCLANSQVPARRFPRARRIARLIGHPVARAAAVFAKSDLMAERFRALGADDVRVMGETRFDMPAPPDHLAAGRTLGDGDRRVLVLGSVVHGEEDIYIEAVQALLAADRSWLVVWVPRAPERFDASVALLQDSGLYVQRRSEVFDDALQAAPGIGDAEVLLGDSLGEMFFYLAAADVVVVGGGFVESGAHNVIEPLSLGKPVITGPAVWTIEFPAVEAEAAGVLSICGKPQDLAPAILQAAEARSAGAEAFHAAHVGASTRIFEAIAEGLKPDR